MKEIKEIISNNLISLRKNHNLTQNDLAEKLAYSDNMVSRWERAEITPSIETLQKISEFYNVPLASLLEEQKAEEVVETPQDTGNILPNFLNSFFKKNEE